MFILGNTLRTLLYKRDNAEYTWNVESKDRLCPDLKLAAENDSIIRNRGNVTFWLVNLHLKNWWNLHYYLFMTFSNK